MYKILKLDLAIAECICELEKREITIAEFDEKIKILENFKRIILKGEKKSA